jgi:hypothetical protein
MICSSSYAASPARCYHYRQPDPSVVVGVNVVMLVASLSESGSWAMSFSV